MYSISCMAIATEVGISPASVYHILTNSLGKWKVCAQWIPHVLNNDQRVMCVLLTITHLLHWRNGGNAFLDHILTVDKSWMCLTISWNDRMLTGMPQCHWVKKLHGTVRVLWKSCMSCFSAKMDLCCTISCQLVCQSVENITACCWRIRWGSTTSLLSSSCRMWLLGVCMCERTSSG